MTDTQTAPTAVDAGPFNDQLSKTDMVEHLTQVHQVHRLRAKAQYGWNNVTLDRNTKVTKETMLKHHTALHEFLDMQTDEWWAQHPEGSQAEVTHRTGELIHYRSTITVPARHTHSELPAASAVGKVPLNPEDYKDTAQRIIEGEIPDKPMPAAERTIVKQLIDNEFGELKQQMREFTADSLRTTLEQVDIDWAERRSSSNVHTKAALKALRKAAKKLDSIRDAAREDGVTLTVPVVYTQSRYVSTAFEGYEKAKREATAENKTALDRALMTLERQRLAAQRTVLMAGMSRAGADLLNAIPTAKELMLEAQREASLAPKELEA